jgi:hypothetical protein
MKRKATEPYTMIDLGQPSMQNPSLLQLALQNGLNPDLWVFAKN